MTTSPFLLLLVGAALVCLGAWNVYYVLSPEIKRLQALIAAKDDKLYAAWKDGFVIPGPEPEPMPAVEPLPEAVEEWLLQWDEAGQRSYRQLALIEWRKRPRPSSTVIIERLELPVLT